MEYFTTDVHGITLVNPDAVQRRRVLESVEEAIDADYPEVFLSLTTGVVLGYRSGGYIAWEEAGEVIRVLSAMDIEQAGQIWDWLIEGNDTALNELDWQPVET